MRQVSSNASGKKASRERVLVVLSVIAIFALALFLRSYWNVGAAVTEEGGFVLSAGSDPYYHKRAIDYIQANGWKTLVFDPLLNYPYGSSNPNPPLFQWSVAIAGAALSPFFGGDVDTSTWYAMLWSPAVWGALTIIPTYLIGRDVFNRRTGVIGAFLLAVSTTHIDHTALGAADHDSMLLFFAVFAFWAFIRAIQSFKGDGKWVTDWRNGSSVSTGLSRFFSERRSGLGWALLAGVLTGSVGLIWKGFPYLIGIFFAYAALAMVIDHWRSKDSTGIWIGTLVTLLVATIMVAPVYSAQNVAGFLKPVWFLVAAHFVFGLVMVPTRDLPTILVIPLGAVVAAIGALVAFFAVPDVARGLLYATVYFKQTNIYQTIAEAHPADFNTMVFGIGPVAFFLALFGLGYLVFTSGRRPTRANLFMIVWAVIAIYMAQSAVRFLFNATPVLAVLAGWTVVLVMDWARFGTISRSMQGAPSFWAGMRRAVNGWHVTTAVLLALLLVFPSVFLAVDAATPPSYEAQFYDEESEDGFMSGFIQKRFGAFGQGFLPDYWNEGLTTLAGFDDFGSDPGNLANRPAFLSWWDYGHWAIEVGEHPAVADNFQNGYVFAANFLLAQNETHSVQLLSARSMGLLDDETSLRLIGEAGVPANESAAVLAHLEAFEFAPQMSLEQAVALEELVRAATVSDVRPDGVRIRYFATDVRMLPYDNPQTSFIEQSSIFYAPVVLAEEEPSDFVELRIRGTDGIEHTEEEFLRKLKDVTRYPNFGSVGQKYVFKQPFFDSMYYRGFVGTPVNAQNGVEGDRLEQALQNARPGFGLTHWRLVVSNDQLRMLEYYPGAVLNGRVLDDGKPVAGASVTAFDDAGKFLYEGLTDLGKAQLTPDDLNVPHQTVTTNADGEFSLIVPFNTEGGNVTVVATSNNAEIARTTLQVSREDANTGAVFEKDLVVKTGGVEGTVFYDADDDGVYNATNGDETVGGVAVSIGGRNATASAGGDYRVTDVAAGSRSVTVESTEYEVSPFSSRVIVQGDETRDFDVALVLKPVTATGSVTFGTNESAPAMALTFSATEDSTGRDQSAPVQNGTYTAQLTPGTYRVTGNFTSDGTTYAVDETIEVARYDEGAVQTFDLVAREES